MRSQRIQYIDDEQIIFKKRRSVDENDSKKLGYFQNEKKDTT